MLLKTATSWLKKASPSLRRFVLFAACFSDDRPLPQSMFLLFLNLGGGLKCGDDTLCCGVVLTCVLWLQVRVCIKEAEQSRDYNERVSAVWRLSKAAVMYKGALQVVVVLVLVLVLVLVVVLVVVMMMMMMMMMLTAATTTPIPTVCAGHQHARHERMCRHGSVVRSSPSSS
jgi:hypothetical protein